MAPSSSDRSVRVVAGEIDTRTLTTRLVIPTAQQPVWSPYHRLAESIAGRGRTLPEHAHEHEEVLTYVTEGFAAYQLENGPVESLAQGAARLLTAPSRTSHRVSPAEGGTIRWFNVVVGLPRSVQGSPRVQSVRPDTPPVVVDNVQVRRLVGPKGGMVSSGGLECQELRFVEESTTFRRVGPDRRAIVYALAGQGSVDEQGIEAGEAALVEGLPGVAVEGPVGFRALYLSAPKAEDAPSSPVGPA